MPVNMANFDWNQLKQQSIEEQIHILEHIIESRTEAIGSHPDKLTEYQKHIQQAKMLKGILLSRELMTYTLKYSYTLQERIGVLPQVKPYIDQMQKLVGNIYQVLPHQLKLKLIKLLDAQQDFIWYDLLPDRIKIAYQQQTIKPIRTMDFVSKINDVHTLMLPTQINVSISKAGKSNTYAFGKQVNKHIYQVYLQQPMYRLLDHLQNYFDQEYIDSHFQFYCEDGIKYLRILSKLIAQLQNMLIEWAIKQAIKIPKVVLNQFYQQCVLTVDQVVNIYNAQRNDNQPTIIEGPYWNTTGQTIVGQNLYYQTHHWYGNFKHKLKSKDLTNLISQLTF